MNAHPAVDGLGLKPLRPRMRRLGLDTMLAWGRLVDAYGKRHPLHQVQIFYHHNRVHDLKRLVEQFPQLDFAGFEIRVVSPEGRLDEVPQLMKLMEGAAGNQLERFLRDANSDAWFLVQPAD